MPITRSCKNCGKTYQAPPSQRLLYCGIHCYNATKTGAGNPKWRGGIIEVGGYLYQYTPAHPNATKAGYVTVHRLTMEQSIGRLLNRGEAVHHINGNRHDNRLENLVLCQSNGRHTMDYHSRARNQKGQFI